MSGSLLSRDEHNDGCDFEVSYHKSHVSSVEIIRPSIASRKGCLGDSSEGGWLRRWESDGIVFGTHGISRHPSYKSRS